MFKRLFKELPKEVLRGFSAVPFQYICISSPSLHIWSQVAQVS